MLALAALAALEQAGAHGVLARVNPPPAAAAEECEGPACSQVTVTFDESKQQYDVRNNSADR